MRLIKTLLSCCAICGIAAAPVRAQGMSQSAKADTMRSQTHSMMNTHDSTAKHAAAKSPMSSKKDTAGMMPSGMKPAKSGGMKSDTKPAAMMGPDKSHMMKDTSAHDSAMAKHGRMGMDSTKSAKKPSA